MSEEPLLIRKDDEGVAVLTLNAPKSINSLSEAMLSALASSLDDIATNPDIKAVILRSRGHHFCAGHNLKEMSLRRTDDDGGLQYFQTLFAQCATVMMRIMKLPQPVIAEVKGIATAAGCQLVASCDLAIASEEAKFATSGVNIGLFCSTPMVALSRNITRKFAMEMLLLGEFVPADRAAEMGLVNRVVARDALETSSMTMARALASKSAAAVKVGKRAFYAQAEMTLEDAYDYTAKIMAENMMFRDTVAGINAFTEKQPMPAWSGQ